MTNILSTVRGPDDLRRLTFTELAELAVEIRKTIIATVSENGGHLASNLGVVELTIALHRVFHSPEDKIVFDVGHQCYTHKLLTGRREQFMLLRRSGGLSGFPKRCESVHDPFNTGHASTSISAAIGLLAGERLRGGNDRTIAVIGDGALTGGLAYEALAHAGQLSLPLIVVLNDNKMSISPNVSGLSKYLSRLSMKAKYQSFRRNFDSIVQNIPLFGKSLFKGVNRVKRAVKAIFYMDNFFVDLGFEYVGPIDGHDEPQLEKILHDVKKLDHPVVVHVITKKGKGYRFAERNPDVYHGVPSFSVENGIELVRTKKKYGGRLFTDAFSDSIVELASHDARVVSITAAMENGTGLTLFKEKFPSRFFDTGITEEHAVTFAAGLALQGFKPVVAIYSTFIQRAMDQIIHDVSLQEAGVVFCLDRAGFVSGDGETHQGLYDIALFRTVPGMTILAPACRDELKAMLHYALSHSTPTMVRYPKAIQPDDSLPFAAPIETGRGVFTRRIGGTVCIAFTGGLYTQVLDAANRLFEQGVAVDLYNLRFLKPVDEDYLVSLANAYKAFAVVEEGISAGGFGEYTASLARQCGCSTCLLTLAVAENAATLGTREELLRLNGLDGASIAAAVLNRL
ncbi:MAG: 1-deoxy-D-xylulose-5-phosphate synthase [Treponema sp.]|jgi:1-deoxy-D-xylulose-5-phosphate synthase|nr:1-deoxy-D-xylulose-5-phosphate synthase [Treponema sp.]